MMRLPGLEKLTFWRQAKPALPALTDESRNDLRQRLIADFQRARYGITFRTLTFPTQISGEVEYFKALATTADLDRWDVQKIVARDMQIESSAYPVETKNLKLRVVQSGLGFFEALEYLARFEQAKTEAPVGPSKADLGNQHYEAFGLLHDIAFNMQGQPQPTIGGHIAVSDEYPVAVLEKLQDAQKQTAEKTKLAGQALVVAPANASRIVAGFNMARRQAEHRDGLQSAHKLVDVWIDIFKDVLTDEEGCLSRDKTSLYERQTGYKIKGTYFDRFAYDWGKKDRFHELYRQSVLYLEKLEGLDQKDLESIEACLKEIAVLGIVEDAKSLAADIHRNKQAKAFQEIDILAAQYSEYMSARPLDKKKLQAQFKANILSAPRMTKIPPHFVEFAERLGEVANQAGKDLQQNLTLIKPPAP